MEKLRQCLKNYHVERLAWCLFVAAFCWTDVADYEQIVYNKKLCIWILIGLFYLWKQGCFEVKNRKITLPCVAIGGGIWGFFLATNFFSYYTFYNYTMGPLIIVLILQYVFLIRDIVIKKQKVTISLTSVCMLLMIVFTQFSPNTEKDRWPFLFFILLPYALMQVSEESRRDIMKGMIDGLCLGFVICQTYTFLFRPYCLDESSGIRYKAFRNYCTYAGLSYLQFYIGYLFRYLMLAEEKAAKWKQCATFIMAAFTLSLMYLTGGRSPVIAVVFVTAVLIAWKCKGNIWKKAILKWSVYCVGLALTSLLLFPVAYAGTRYLPTIINHPDLQDSEGNRLYSFSTVVLKQKFLYNGEWNMWSVKANESVDSARYVSFAECFGESLGRIIPGVDKLVDKYASDVILETQIDRVVTLYKEGYISVADLETYILSYSVLQKKEIPKYAVDFLADLQTQTSALPIFKLSVSSISEETAKTLVGTDMEHGWFEANESYNSVQLRNAIHTYAFRNLNLFGHARHSFKLYYQTGNETYIGHPHNIFLIMGFDYGIVCMLFMVVAFVLLAGKSAGLSVRNKNIYDLLPFVLVAGMAIYGWYESGFGVGNSYSEMIVLCTVLFKKNERATKRLCIKENIVKESL